MFAARVIPRATQCVRARGSLTARGDHECPGSPPPNSLRPRDYPSALRPGAFSGIVFAQMLPVCLILHGHGGTARSRPSSTPEKAEVVHCPAAMSGGETVELNGESDRAQFRRAEERQWDGKMKRRSSRNKSHQLHSSSSEISKKSHKEQSQITSRKDGPTEEKSTEQLWTCTINSSSIRNEDDQMVTPRPSIRNARKRNVDHGLGSESSEPEKKSRKDGAAAAIYPQINVDRHPPGIAEGLESQSSSEPEKMDCSDDVNLDTVLPAEGDQAEDDKELAASPKNPAGEDVDAEAEMEFDRVQNCSGSTMLSADRHHHLNKTEPQDCSDTKQSSQFISLNASVGAHQRSSYREHRSFTDTKQSSQFTRPNASVGAHQCSSYREHRSFTDTKQSSQFTRPNVPVVSYQRFSHSDPQSYTDRKQSSQFIGPNVSGSRFSFWKFAIPLMGLLAILSIFVCCHWPSKDTAHQLIKEREVRLLDNWKEIQNKFPNQHQELWTRSEVLLKKHAASATHTRPVVLMFTAAQDAKETLRCLTREIAGVYASAFNSGVVEVDGSEKKLLNSDQVKLDIDNQLSSAFKEGRKAAVIHHFQDLPPASSLLFYKYCDHENAAFKDVPMLITVSLDKLTLNPDLSLITIEEMVHNFLKMKFCSSTQGAHNEMDVDKLSGLWGRIAHIVLPVRPVNEIEAKGCPLI